jgi:hypothetical protein
MKRSTGACILSLLTVFGGHYFNGRPAKALLFGMVLVAGVGLGALAVFCVFAPSLLGDDMYVQGMVGYLGRFRVFVILITVAIVVVWAASALTAALEARAREPEAVPEEGGDSLLVRNLVGFAMCGLGMATLAALPLLIYATVWLPGYLTTGGPYGSRFMLSRLPYGLDLRLPMMEGSPPQPRAGYLGSPWRCVAEFDWEAKKFLAAGNGEIRGLVRANGKPVAGLQLHLCFAPDLRTGWGVSDANGWYSIRLPTGKYRLAGWQLDPASANSALAGKINAEQGPWDFGRLGQVLTVEANAPTTGLNFDFIDAVVRVRPLNGIHVSRDVVFEWKPYPGASYYRLSVTDNGTNPYSDHYMPSTLRSANVRGTTTTAVLAGLALKPGHYYGWGVEAYGSNRKQIGSSGEDWTVAFKVE